MKEPTISIQGTENIASVEAYYRQLDRAVDTCDLLLPTKLRHWRIGGRAALIQFIITWAKRFPRGRLVCHIQDLKDAEKVLDRLCDQDHGLVAILMAPDI